jgi:fructose-specific phosphotransferase system component IIB
MRGLFIKKTAKITKQSGTSNHWQYSYEISSENILSELDWLPLKDRFRNKKAMFAYNVKNNIKLPQSMIGKYEMKNNSNHNLRNNNTDFVLKKPKSNFMKKNILPILLE